MNIYKIWQNENNDYETFDSAIVYAETEEEARNIHPDVDGYQYYDNPWTKPILNHWASSPDKVMVEKIGETTLDVKSGVILASFNAG